MSVSTFRGVLPLPRLRLTGSAGLRVSVEFDQEISTDRNSLLSALRLSRLEEEGKEGRFVEDIDNLQGRRVVSSNTEERRRKEWV